MLGPQASVNDRGRMRIASSARRRRLQQPCRRSHGCSSQSSSCPRRTRARTQGAHRNGSLRQAGASMRQRSGNAAQTTRRSCSRASRLPPATAWTRSGSATAASSFRSTSTRPTRTSSASVGVCRPICERSANHSSRSTTGSSGCCHGSCSWRCAGCSSGCARPRPSRAGRSSYPSTGCRASTRAACLPTPTSNRLRSHGSGRRRYHAALILTHDVETGDGLRRALELADLEQERGFRSSFNVVAGDYPIDDGILRELTDRGFEIGLHGLHHDRSLFSSRAEFERQLPALVGSRRAVRLAWLSLAGDAPGPRVAAGIARPL